MQWTTFKRPRVWIPGSILLTLLITFVVLFHPAFQKAMLLRYATPHLDQLQVERIHLTPWSLQVVKLKTGYQGGVYSLNDMRMRFCVSALLLKKIRISDLQLKDAVVDLRELNPATETNQPTEPFKGVMNSLEHGFSYQLDQLFANATLLLPNQQQLQLDLKSDGIKPENNGEIIAKARFDTGKDDDHVIIDTRLRLDQLAGGKFKRIENLSSIELALSALPQTEYARLSIAVNRVDAAVANKDTNDGIVASANDNYAVKLEILDSDSHIRSTLTTEADYDGSTATTKGIYQFSANQNLLQPYLPEQSLPPLHQLLDGEFSYALKNQTGEISVLSNLKVSDLQKQVDSQKVPQLLKINSDFIIRLLADQQIQVSTLNALIEDGEDKISLTARTPEPLEAPLDNLPALLSKKNTLIEFELPELPLQWFDFLLADYEIETGSLSAAFRILTDEKSTIYLQPLKPTKVNDLTLVQNKIPVFENLNLSVLPKVSYVDSTIEVTLQELSLLQGKNELLTALGKSRIRLEDKNTLIQFDSNLHLNTYPTIALLNPAATTPGNLPKSFTLNVQSNLSQNASELRFDAASVDIHIQNKKPLLHASLLQSIQLKPTKQGQQLVTPSGQIAKINFSDIDLSWVSAFVPSVEMTGVLQRASFSYSGNPSSSALIADKPVKFDNVTLKSDNSLLLKNIDLSLTPTVKLDSQTTSVSYKNLSIASVNRSLAKGNGEFSMNTDQNSTQAIGDIEIDLQAISQQPLLQKQLQGSIASGMKIRANYAIDLLAEKIKISTLNGELNYADDKPRIILQADSGVTIPIKNLSGATLGNGARGKITLQIKQLTPEPFQHILDQNHIRFHAINGKLVLSSSGSEFKVDFVEPFFISDLSAGPTDQPLLTPVTISTRGTVSGNGNSISANLNELNIGDSSATSKMIQANVAVDLRRKQNGPMALYKVKADSHALLPSLLKQPTLLPNHKLKAGLLDLDFELTPDLKARSYVKVHQVEAKNEMPLKDLTIDLQGTWNHDGSFRMGGPVRTNGKSGKSDLNVTLDASPWNHERRQLNIKLLSSLFYLNDILNTVSAIQGNAKKPAKKSPDKQDKAAPETEAVTLNTEPDEKAFWDALPYNASLAFDIEKLYYTDYLIIDSVEGQSEMSTDKLSITDFSAYFHDSPLRINSLLTFSAQSANPYNLNMDASITQFDLAAFLKELVPKSKPRAEGLFDISFTANGKSPNLEQYRNELFFDMRLKSRDGLFRILDPNSALVSGSTNTLGAIGEGVSYIPTGLFGVGAVSRLVKYIKVIDYDKIDIHLTRDQSRNISIDQYLVQNPELLITANGGITYSQGRDVLRSPMNMEAQLSFKGHGAAIMYDLDLLTKQKNQYGYWIGPTVKVTGTAAESHSNLNEIITQAGNGAVWGGITRPVSGLIGNIRYRWFKEKDTKANDETKERK